MSAPSFLLANGTNYLLLQSLLESMNAIIEHQYESKQHDLVFFLGKYTNRDLQVIQLLFMPS